MRVDQGPTISLEGARLIVSGTPIAESIDAIYAYAVTAGLDPAFVLAVARKETQFGIPMERSIGDLPHRNAWALRNHGWIAAGRGYNGADGWAHYYTYFDAAQDHVDLITGYGRGPSIYIPSGRDTVREIITIYAPASENYTELYIQQVERWMGEWAQAYPPVPAGPTLEERVEALEAGYDALAEMIAELQGGGVMGSSDRSGPFVVVFVGYEGIKYILWCGVAADRALEKAKKFRQMVSEVPPPGHPYWDEDGADYRWYGWNEPDRICVMAPSEEDNVYTCACAVVGLSLDGEPILY